MKIIDFFRNLFRKLPDPSTIDRTGIVNSDVPHIDNGWIKGWCVDTPGRNVIIVCKHSNPRPGNTIFVRDDQGMKIVRTITKVDDRPLDGYEGLDVAVCQVEPPFPPTIRLYDMAFDLTNYQKSVTFDQHGQISRCKLALNSKLRTVSGNNRDHQLVPGDSGLPWFVWEDTGWRVCTHTFRGLHGIGPWYTHNQIVSALLTRIHQWDKP